MRLAKTPAPGPMTLAISSWFLDMDMVEPTFDATSSRRTASGCSGTMWPASSSGPSSSRAARRT